MGSESDRYNLFLLILGMLIDEKQFEISEILGLFNEAEELRSRV